jgi:hypothetical protein
MLPVGRVRLRWVSDLVAAQPDPDGRIRHERALEELDGYVFFGTL